MLDKIEDNRVSGNALASLFGYAQYLWLLLWKFIIYPLERLFLSEQRQTLKDDMDKRDLQPVKANDIQESNTPEGNVKKLSSHDKDKCSDTQDIDDVQHIEVIHERQVPKLHSILKQRSISESSDDINNSYCRQFSNDSVISESDENTESWKMSHERKRKVSFNDRVDSASFKQHQSVSIMKQTLKNKRQNQRKAEKRRQGRRRRNSNSVSEPSGDEYVMDDIENQALTETLTFGTEYATSRSSSCDMCLDESNRETLQGMESVRNVAGDFKSGDAIQDASGTCKQGHNKTYTKQNTAGARVKNENL